MRRRINTAPLRRRKPKRKAETRWEDWVPAALLLGFDRLFDIVVWRRETQTATFCDRRKTGLLMSTVCVFWMTDSGFPLVNAAGE
jgi:hypothetical protein